MSKKTEEKAAVPAVQSGGALALPASALEKLQKAKPTDDFGNGDFLVPYLSIVQGISGYVKKSHENYVEDARVGDIIDNVSKRPRDVTHVILCKFETHYTEWKANSGILVKQWFTDSSKYDACGDEFGKRLTPEGGEISPSKVYYVLEVNLENGKATPMVWALGGMQAKKARRINSLARMEIETANGPILPPIYARIFELTTRDEDWGDGNSGPGWKAEPAGLVLANEKYGERWWAAAEAFREQIEKGNVRPQPPVETESREDADGAAPATGKKLDDDIPF